MQRNMMKVAASLVVLAMGAAVQAASFDLTSVDSAARVNYGFTNTGAYSAANPLSGMNFLYRNAAPANGDHIQDVVQQTYFYRTSTSGGVQEINTGATINPTLTKQVSSSFAQVGYSYSGFDIVVQYKLTGSAAGTFSNVLTRDVFVRNNTGSTLSIDLWSYSDYTLTGVSSAKPTNAGSPKIGDAYADNNYQGVVGPDGFEFAEVKTVSGKKTVTQWDSWGNPVPSTNKNLSHLVNGFDKSGAGQPDVVEATDNSGTLLAKILGGTGLTQTNGQVGGQNGTGEALDVAFAAQWHFDIAANSTVKAYESTQIVPEPASMALLALGGLMLVGRRR